MFFLRHSSKELLNNVTINTKYHKEIIKKQKFIDKLSKKLYIKGYLKLLSEHDVSEDGTSMTLKYPGMTIGVSKSGYMIPKFDSEAILYIQEYYKIIKYLGRKAMFRNVENTKKIINNLLKGNFAEVEKEICDKSHTKTILCNIIQEIKDMADTQICKGNVQLLKEIIIFRNKHK